jgi:hypothetical protein
MHIPRSAGRGIPHRLLAEFEKTCIKTKGQTVRLKKLSALALFACLLSGCASYSHTRIAADGTRETTSVGTLLMTGGASKLNSSVTDGTYKRTVGVGAIAGAGDAAMLRAIFEAGMAAGQKAALP